MANKNNDAKKWATFRTVMRSIGIYLISAGAGAVSSGNPIGFLMVIGGLLALGIKDYFEEKR